MDWFRKRRLGDLPAEAAARWGDRTALIYKGRSWTHAEFAAEVDRVAKGLIGLGVAPGEKVGVWMVNRPEWLFLMYAIPRVGGVTVPLNTRYRTDDVAYTVDQSDTVTLVANDRSGPVDYSAMLRQALPDLPKLKRLVILGDDRPERALGWDDLLAAGALVDDGTLLARAAAVDPDEPTLVIYTSGTTSLPKGAVHTHIWIRNLAERAMLMGNTCEDVQITYLPLFHAYGYSEIAAMTALTGGAQVLVETFDPDEILDLAEYHGVTIFHGFDAQWTDLLRAQQTRPRELRLRYGSFAAGMESSTPIAYRTQDVFCPTVSGWGMSETWAFVSASHPGHSVEQRCEASGYPMLDIEVRVIDPATGEDLPANMPGELLVRGYTLMKGYYEKPAETAEAIDADGWMHTGDLCRMRPDGHLVFMGRLKDMLKIGGENVAPAEVEGRLRTIDGVIDAAVVGYPDPRLGEVPVAYLAVEPGATLDEEGVLGHLRGRIASFKIPRHVRLVDALPMTPSGKVRKVELRARALDELGDPSHG